MAIYAVHCPTGEGEAAALERAEFVKLGFCRTALVFGPLWLLAHRLWRPLALWLIGAALVGFALASGVLGADAAVGLYVLSALYLGLEGRALQGAALTRRGRPLADVVCARDASAAEFGFFTRALVPPPPRGTQRAAPPPPSSAPPEVLGLFPQAGR
ncbi:MAG: DUF2628 domain-containing protein [Roseiarcus sp.]